MDEIAAYVELIHKYKDIKEVTNAEDDCVKVEDVKNMLKKVSEYRKNFILKEYTKELKQNIDCTDIDLHYDFHNNILMMVIYNYITTDILTIKRNDDNKIVLANYTSTYENDFHNVKEIFNENKDIIDELVTKIEQLKKLEEQSFDLKSINSSFICRFNGKGEEEILYESHLENKMKSIESEKITEKLYVRISDCPKFIQKNLEQMRSEETNAKSLKRGFGYRFKKNK